ncbi:MAG: hypothetical protein ABI051_08640 [Vicinamibacterales bacterium]
MTSNRFLLSAAVIGLAVSLPPAFAQTPAPPSAAGQTPAGGGGRGGAGRGGGLPDATPEQTQALTDMMEALAPQIAAATTARAELGSVALSSAGRGAGINAAAEKLRTAEIALATARAQALLKLQSGPNKLTPEQLNALIAAGGNLGGGRGGAGRGRGN